MRCGHKYAVSFEEQGVTGDLAQAIETIGHRAHAALGACCDSPQVTVLHNENKDLQ
ncbi:hypothetical protein CBM2606_P140002 [Cupriavidus taiwanensis]|nr:hypothetical protein CBM2606_P140002 [Cupriavidus taiwanensis]